jgi:hypothetical protein
MEIRQLSYFVAVAEELHFGRAAMRVNIALPALSTQVQALEKGLGVQLLVRSTPKVELRRAGEVFYDRCIRMLGELDLSAEMARAARVSYCSCDRGGEREASCLQAAASSEGRIQRSSMPEQSSPMNRYPSSPACARSARWRRVQSGPPEPTALVRDLAPPSVSVCSRPAVRAVSYRTIRNSNL